jgi:integrase/recombinase XerD
MLDRCFVHPETLVRIRSSWIGPPIERYAAWLGERGYRPGTLVTRLSILRQFATFAQERDAERYEDLPAHVEPFLEFWLQRPHERRTSPPPRQARHARIAIEQMLSLVVSGFVGRPRRHAIRDPFADQAPGFSSYLRNERGLREATLGLYDEHLRAFAAYLIDIGQNNLRTLAPAVVTAFLIERSGHLKRSTMQGRCGVLRVFFRYLFRERLVVRDLSPTVEASRSYRLAHLPRSITATDVRRMLAGVDRHTVLGRRD